MVDKQLVKINIKQLAIVVTVSLDVGFTDPTIPMNVIEGWAPTVWRHIAWQVKLSADGSGQGSGLLW